MIAAVVSLLLGVILHPHLAELLLPISTSLYVGGYMAMSKERNKRSAEMPLVAVSLVRGLNIWQRRRPCKYQQLPLPRRGDCRL